MTAKAMDELKAPVVKKIERPVRISWSCTSREATALITTKLERNSGAETDNDPVLKDWEHKLKVEEYMEGYKTHKGGTKAWEENKGKYYYLVPQHCLP